MKKIFRMNKVIAYMVAMIMLLSGLPVESAASLSEKVLYAEPGIEDDADYPDGDIIIEDSDFIPEDQLSEKDIIFDDTDDDFSIEDELPGREEVNNIYADGIDELDIFEDDTDVSDMTENSGDEWDEAGNAWISNVDAAKETNSIDYFASFSKTEEFPDDGGLKHSEEEPEPLEDISGETTPDSFPEDLPVFSIDESVSEELVGSGDTASVDVSLRVFNILQVKRGFTVSNENKNLADFEFILRPLSSKRAEDADTLCISDIGEHNSSCDRLDTSGSVAYTGYWNQLTFKPMHFTEPGTFEYEVTETNNSAPGYSYSGSVYKATVKVTADKDNKLKAAVSYERTNGSETKTAKGITFTNSYEPDPITETLQVSKEISGEPDGNHTFTFLLSRAANNAEVERITIKGRGTVSFSSRKFGMPGTYTYVISEISGTDSYVYDKGSYVVKITISDQGGVLTKDVTYTKDNASYTEAKFTNTFVRGSFTFYKVRFDKQNQGVKDATYQIYGIAASDRSSSTYQSTVSNLSRGKVNYDQLTRLDTQVSAANGKVTFENLQSDSFYVIREAEAPMGYQISKNPIIIHTVFVNGRFGYTITSSGSHTVARDSQTGIVKWFEHRVHVIIYKKKSNGELLAGAKLQLIDTTTGNLVEEWTSRSGGAYMIVAKLQTGRTYKIVETAAPKGYKIAPDTYFEVMAYPIIDRDYFQIITIIDKAVVAVKSLKFEKSAYTIKKGSVLQLRVKLLPSNATDRKVTWKSSNAKIVKVSSTGKITGIKPGTATVTAASANGKKASCKVTVVQPVTSVKLNKSKASIVKGNTLQLKATVLPTSASNKKITWKSSNPNVAKVSSTGKVTGIKRGTATITAVSNNGKKAICKITVTAP